MNGKHSDTDEFEVISNMLQFICKNYSGEESIQACQKFSKKSKESHDKSFINAVLDKFTQFNKEKNEQNENSEDAEKGDSGAFLSLHTSFDMDGQHYEVKTSLEWSIYYNLYFYVRK